MTPPMRGESIRPAFDAAAPSTSWKKSGRKMTAPNSATAVSPTTLAPHEQREAEHRRSRLQPGPWPPPVVPRGVERQHEDGEHGRADHQRRAGEVDAVVHHPVGAAERGRDEDERHRADREVDVED